MQSNLCWEITEILTLILCSNNSLRSEWKTNKNPTCKKNNFEKWHIRYFKNWIASEYTDQGKGTPRHMKTGQILMYLKELPRATCLFKLLHVYFAISIQVKHLEGNFKISLRSCKYKEERKDRREEGRERGEKKKNI